MIERLDQQLEESSSLRRSPKKKKISSSSQEVDGKERLLQIQKEADGAEGLFQSVNAASKLPAKRKRVLTSREKQRIAKELLRNNLNFGVRTPEMTSAELNKLLENWTL